MPPNLLTETLWESGLRDSETPRRPVPMNLPLPAIPSTQPSLLDGFSSVVVEILFPASLSRAITAFHHSWPVWYSGHLEGFPVRVCKKVCQNDEGDIAGTSIGPIISNLSLCSSGFSKCEMRMGIAPLPSARILCITFPAQSCTRPLAMQLSLSNCLSGYFAVLVCAGARIDARRMSAVMDSPCLFAMQRIVQCSDNFR